MYNKSLNFIRRLKKEKCLFFKLDFLNFAANSGMVVMKKIQNFSSISLKLCLLGQTHGIWGVNTTLGFGHCFSSDDLYHYQMTDGKILTL